MNKAPTTAESAETSQQAAPAILLRNVVKTYPGGIQAVKGVSLQIARRESVALMGKSGSGKSTLLNLMGTLDRPDSGDIEFSGRSLQSLGNLAAFRRHEMGFVFQLHYLLPHLTLLENVALPLQGNRDAKNLAVAALERVGLGHRVRHVPGKVSGGERQRAAIARAIVNKPKILLADEPTGNVDSENESGLLDLFDELRETLEMTLMVVTHERSVAERADRILHYRDGIIDSEETRPWKSDSQEP
jgi:ABC-type lipoprotein export system ATPase subunit